MSRTRKIIMIIIAVVAVAMIIVSGIYGFFSVRTNRYNEHVRSANKAYDVGNYESAVLEYLEALKLQPDNFQTYLELANLYVEDGNVEEAKEVLRNGIRKTNSVTLRNRLYELEFVQFGEEYEKEDNYIFDSGFLYKLATFTYSDYMMSNGIASSSPVSTDEVNVRMNGISADYVYQASDNQPNAVVNGQVSDVAIPENVRLDDIMMLFGGGEQITYETMQELGLKQLSQRNYGSSGSIITFAEEQCQVTIYCAEEGVVKRSDSNNIHPIVIHSAAVAEEFGTSRVHGSITDAQNGNSVSGLNVIAHRGSYHYGQVEAQTVSDSFGQYELNLVPGSYTIEITGNGYASAYKELYVGISQDESISDFVVSKTVITGTMRIVLEWNASPSDLDSHLVCDSHHLFFASKVMIDNSEVIAELDRDDIDGYGPETVTIYDVSRTYRYFVHDYTYSGYMNNSGARVTVYTADGNSQTININTSISGDIWSVLTISDGNVTVENTGNIWRY